VRVAVLYNEDEGLAHGEPSDLLAARGVLDAARGVAEACRECGWDPVEMVAPPDPAILLQQLERARCQVVFHLVEAVRGEARLEAAVAWLLEWARIPYTGSPPVALSVALDKPLCRAVLQAHGVPVAAGRVLARADGSLEGLRFPLIVKPSREDASHGITLDSVVTDAEGARGRARYVLERYAQPALVEEFVEGREFNVSLLGEGEAARTLPLAEIDYSRWPAGKPRLITYAAKWEEGSEEDRGSVAGEPGPLEPALARRIEEVALAAYRAVGLRDYGRVDLRLHPAAGPIVLVVNGNPDLAPGAGLARSAARAGISHARLVAGIVEAALARAR
jgi:D-alanine-D-alanine ligase